MSGNVEIERQTINHTSVSNLACDDVRASPNTLTQAFSFRS